MPGLGYSDLTLSEPQGMKALLAYIANPAAGRRATSQRQSAGAGLSLRRVLSRTEKPAASLASSETGG